MRKTRLYVAAVGLMLLLGGCGSSAGDALSMQGMQKIEAGSYEEALSLAEEAVGKGEVAYLALRTKGIALLGLGRYEEAATALQAAYEATDSKMPKNRRDILMYLVEAQLGQGNAEKAIDICEQVQTDYGRSAEVFYQKGLAYLELDRQDDAKENFDLAVDMDTRNYALYLQIYELYADRALSGIGDAYLQKALLIVPESDEDRYEIGVIYYDLGNYDKAKESIEQPVASGHAASIALLGQIYLAQESYDQAQATYQSLLSADGESTEGYNGLALCALAAGDYTGALSYIESGLALDGEAGKQQLRFNEIVAYERELDFATAKMKAEAYVALYPADEAGQKEWKFLQTRG